MTRASESPQDALLYRPRNLSLHPPPFAPHYRSTALRGPRREMVVLESTLTETTGPAFGHDSITAADSELVTNMAAAGQSAIGERIIIAGQVQDENRRPVRDALIEIWQANAGGRYRHHRDDYLAPLDPNFSGCGRCMTDEYGRYRFSSVRPGPYPWPNGPNDWRPSHIHLSIFGDAFSQRLITQLYFEGDPLIARCPIIGTLPDDAAAQRLVARLDMESSVPMDSLCYRFDIVLRGTRQTPFENRPEGA